MMKELEVVYNGDCPVCSTEVGVYRRHAEAAALPIRFSDLHDTDLARIGLTRDEAARAFHVLKDGELLAGVDAFIALWSSLPRYRWAATVVGLPVINPLAKLVYRFIAAPLLYRMHRRRLARAAHTQTRAKAPGGKGAIKLQAQPVTEPQEKA